MMSPNKPTDNRAGMRDLSVEELAEVSGGYWKITGGSCNSDGTSSTTYTWIDGPGSDPWIMYLEQ